jgi:hypothetical protein
MSYHIIYHIISYHIISYIISYINHINHIISNYIIYHTISYHIYHIISYHISYHIYHIIISYRIIYQFNNFAFVWRFFYVHDNVNCPYSDIYFLFFFSLSQPHYRTHKKYEICCAVLQLCIVGTAVKAVCLRVGSVFRRVLYTQSETIVIQANLTFRVPCILIYCWPYLASTPTAIVDAANETRRSISDGFCTGKWLYL